MVADKVRRAAAVVVPADDARMHRSAVRFTTPSREDSEDSARVHSTPWYASSGGGRSC